VRIALAGLFVFGLRAGASAPAVLMKNAAGLHAVVDDTTKVVAYFKDTGLVAVFSSKARTFRLRTRGQRDSLRATLRKERALWRAKRPRDYRFLLRVGCFCPGVRGWLLMDVRKNQPLRVWDRTGTAVALTDWNMFSIDELFDNLERSIDHYGTVQIAFDPRWHFPAYVHTAALPGPDMWAVIDARALRASAQP
jgi:hypothetical protein